MKTKASQFSDFLHQRVAILRRFASQLKVLSTTHRLAGKLFSPGIGHSSFGSFLRHEGGEERYRVTGETVVAVERVGMPWAKEPNKLEKLEYGRVEQMTTASLKRMVLPGDAVAVPPVWELPELSKKDEAGAYLVFTLVIRRGRGL